MTRTCGKCGASYSVGGFSFDPGVCCKCAPKFYELPLWLHAGSQVGTRSLWLFQMGLHVFLLVFSGLGFDMEPIAAYSFSMLAYLTIRYAVGAARSFPLLTKFQMIVIAALPVWGLILWIPLFNLGQGIRYGFPPGSFKPFG